MESSSSSSSRTVGGFLSSPRGQRRMIIFSGVVLVVGFIAFLSAYLLKGTSGIHSPISTVPAQTHPKSIKAPPSPQALKVAREFIETAVLRKNLDKAYDITGPALRGNMTRAEWRKGNIAVAPYPARNTKTAAFTVDWSYQNQIMLEVDLVAKKGSGANIRPHLPYFLGLERKGGRPDGAWQVNTWISAWHPPIPLYGGGG
jgi:hypothetical protein